jgi:SAM-dependent methyltransferase
MTQYFSGEQLYGEDLTAAEREQWYQDEREGYAELVQTYSHAYTYNYHARNVEHGFRHLQQPAFARVLGIGSAAGYEFEPIVERCGEITILEPSEGLTNPRFEYVRPDISGLMPFPDHRFDLVTCLSALHHIPNVSTYLREIARVLVPGGVALISEPITSMGDWRNPRPGLTQHERGIPLPWFRARIEETGMAIDHEHLTDFPLMARWHSMMATAPHNIRWVVKLDCLICRLPIWFRRYHARRWWQKFRATGVFFIVHKPG